MVNIKKHITIDEVKHLAWLSKIELSNEEEELLVKQLNTILEYFSKIDELKTEEIEPAYHVIPVNNVWRDDEVTNFLSTEEILQAVPCLRGRYIRAPRIV